jgi:hypothetical protein
MQASLGCAVYVVVNERSRFLHMHDLAGKPGVPSDVERCDAGQPDPAGQDECIACGSDAQLIAFEPETPPRAPAGFGPGLFTRIIAWKRSAPGDPC